jgi:hypothetical protein
MEKILNTRQRKAIESLALGNTRRRTAKIAGVTEPTIYNWLKVPEFREELSRSREEVLSIGVTRLTGKIDLAISILTKGAKAKPGDPITADQIRAANYLLIHGRAYTELSHFAERLEYALEQIEELKRAHETDNNGA